MYFPEQESIFEKLGEDIRKTVEVVAGRYIGQNPALPVTYRAFCNSGIRMTSDLRYNFQLDDVFPNAECEARVFAWSKYWGESDTVLNLSISGYGPVTIFLNGEAVFKTNVLHERSSDNRSDIQLRLRPGWNDLILRFIKTKAGFGGIVGSASVKRRPVYFLMPSLERDGQEGWLFTQPLQSDLTQFPAAGMSEDETCFTWYPQREWSPGENTSGRMERIFGLREKAYAIGWTKGYFSHPGLTEYKLEGSAKGSIAIYIDGKSVYESPSSTNFCLVIPVSYGKHDIVVKSGCLGPGWGYDLQLSCNGVIVSLSTPYNVKGAKDPWFYGGVFYYNNQIDPATLCRMDQLLPGADGETYWRLDMPDTWIRAYLETPLFGDWNYPLGVTLYGLVRAGKVFKWAQVLQYTKEHIEQATSLFRYALWDKQRFGAAHVHNMLMTLNSLDDCGSFGSTMLELAETEDVKDFRLIADFIENKQERLPDGAFCRIKTSMPYMSGTMWADDLYMSVPFLCRYYKLSGDERYINDAVQQLLLFPKYLYISERRIFSHVYDMNKQRSTGIPWGRGNGWVAFTFSELLSVLPEDHPDRPTLIAFFNTICRGYLELQDQDGMWHQVLTDADSYQESSCTAMFVYAFSRGIRYGWLEDPEIYISSVFKGWEGLIKTAIDARGNLYGVCSGSRFSFSADYYKNELLWNLNDTHGIGIVILAGLETWLLQNWLQTRRG